MKPTGIIPGITPRHTDEFTERYNKLWNYLRPDGLNAVFAPVKMKPAKQAEAAEIYFKPTEYIPNAVKEEGVGEIIDFRFG